MPKSAQTSPVAAGRHTKSPTTASVAARVQSAVAKQHGGGAPKGSYAGRLQKAAVKPAK